MKKSTIIISIIVVIILAIFVVILYNKYNAPDSKDDTLVGNDTDSHGCIGSAGYSWCEKKQKCIRIWEESCDIEADAKTFCNPSQNVSVCGDYIVVSPRALDAGRALYKYSATTAPITCPGFAPRTEIPPICDEVCMNLTVKNIC